MSVSPDALKAALETYELESALAAGLNEEALKAALAAGIRAHEQQVLARVAGRAETYAREIEAADGDEDGMPPEAAALAWFAHKLRQEMELDPSGPYEPEAGDVVEVTITGPVTTWHDLCSGCGQMSDRHNNWSVADDHTGQDFVFQPGSKANVRVLARARDQVNSGD